MHNLAVASHSHGIVSLVDFKSRCKNLAKPISKLRIFFFKEAVFQTLEELLD